MVVFSDAVHPEHQIRPAHGWFPKGQKTAPKATSGRKRLNIQGALDLETLPFTFVEGEKINAQTTRQILEELERSTPTMTAIHVFLDNARYHHAKILQPWHKSTERRGNFIVCRPMPHTSTPPLSDCMHSPVGQRSKASGASCTNGSPTITAELCSISSSSSRRSFGGASGKPCSTNGARSATLSRITSALYRSSNTGQSEPKASGQFRRKSITKRHLFL